MADLMLSSYHRVHSPTWCACIVKPVTLCYSQRGSLEPLPPQTHIGTILSEHIVHCKVLLKLLGDSWFPLPSLLVAFCDLTGCGEDVVATVFDCDLGWAIRMLGCWCGLTALESTVIAAYRKADWVDTPPPQLRRTAPCTTKACARRDESCSYTSKLKAKTSGLSVTRLNFFCLQLLFLTGGTIGSNYLSAFCPPPQSLHCFLFPCTKLYLQKGFTLQI